MSEIRAKVTKEFSGVPDGDVYPRMIEIGEEISGSLAETAIAEKWAKETRDSKADRSAADDDAEQAALEQAARDAEAAEIEAKRDENRAKLALLTHVQLLAIAEEHQVDLSGTTSEEGVIEAIQNTLESLNLEVPAPTIAASTQEPEQPETTVG